VVIRERALSGTSLGGTLPAVFASEDAAASFIRARVDRASTVHADEAPAWNALHARFDTRRINHSVEYANDEACTNQAESYFARLRRGEMGHHHRISGVYLVRYARESVQSSCLSAFLYMMSAMPPAPVLQPVGLKTLDFSGICLNQPNRVSADHCPARG
jgi:ISXO2-like transposase domain